MSDCAGSRGSRDRRMGCPGDPWIPAARQGRADPGSLVDLQDGREAASLVTCRRDSARPPTATASDLQPRPPLSASHLRTGYKHHAWGKEKLKELSSVINGIHENMDTGINDVICILTALGAPVGKDYHRIFKTTSSEGSFPASVAPGRLQKQGRKEVPLQGVLPSLGATTWPASLSQGPLLGWTLRALSSTFGLRLLGRDGTSEFLPLGKQLNLNPEQPAASWPTRRHYLLPLARCCNGDLSHRP